MGSDKEVTSWDYNADHLTLKLCFSDGSGAVYKPVPHFIHQNLLRSTNKTAFVKKYIEYDLHFHKLSID